MNAARAEISSAEEKPPTLAPAALIAGDLLLADLHQLRDLGLPLLRTALVHRVAVDVHRDRHWHVLHLEFVDGFHAEILERQHARFLDRLRDEIRRAADRHQVNRLMVANSLDRCGTALRLAHHAEKASLLQHLASELIHARGGSWAGWTNDLISNWVNRSHVIDKAIGEVHGKLLAALEHLGHALVRGIATSEQLATEQEHFADLPSCDFLTCNRVEVHSARADRIIGQLRPVIE